MELTTLLNRCHHFKGFVYGKTRFAEARPNTIEVGWFPVRAPSPIARAVASVARAMTSFRSRAFSLFLFGGSRITRM